MNKYFCFRFDVDTHRCLKKGVPNLINLARALDVPFTFFINMGRGVSRFDYIKNIICKYKKNSSKISKLSNLKKLGLVDYFIAATLNPKVGISYCNITQLLHQSGHEIGLHGGLNHATWQNYASSWSEKKIYHEVATALQELQLQIDRPVGFSSPGWKGSSTVYHILEQLGFEYVADIHGDNFEELNSKSSLVEVPTNIVGEPGGVGYIEYMRAIGKADNEIIEDFSKRLQNKKIAIAYDHPCYAGIQELHIVKNMINTARSMGFEVTTLKNIVRKLKD